MRKRLGILLLLLLGLLPTIRAAASEGAAHPPETAPKRLAVLFVGNSLTYVNDMPSMLERLLVDSGYETRIETLAHPNFGLEDHWRRRDTRKAIRTGDWDYVVFQQGPSASEGRPSLLAYSKKFAGLVREHGGEPALYMVWPSRARFSDFDGVADSYRTAAQAVSGLLLPVGDAWREAWKIDPDLALYGDDGFHPSGAGSFLAALVIYRGLTGIDPASTLRTSTLRTPADDPQAETLRVLTMAASRANAEP